MVVKGGGKEIASLEYEAGLQVVSVVNTDTNLQYSTRFFGQMPLVDGIHPKPLGPSQEANFVFDFSKIDVSLTTG